MKRFAAALLFASVFAETAEEKAEKEAKKLAEQEAKEKTESVSDWFSSEQKPVEWESISMGGS